ncbi:hypothetical protein BACPU_04300 [Bacillus pumilus]|nr:hypothetical protein BACPU_04300 [Bacillus pumilus]
MMVKHKTEFVVGESIIKKHCKLNCESVYKIILTVFLFV